MDWKGKKVLVVGMARSGVSSAKLLLQLGAEVWLYDRRKAEELNLGDWADACHSLLGGDPQKGVQEVDMLVLSPGVPIRQPFIEAAQQAKKPVISEIELGYLTSQAEFVCISGTNGKTTTTMLTGEIFKNAGRNTYVLGNIGVPITETSLLTQKGDIVVAETAALQLETIETFRPRAAALLNVTEDHMDRFGTMEYYTACKMRLFENQTKEDFAILNLDDPITCEQEEKVASSLFWFSRMQEVKRGAFLKDGCIVFRDKGVDTPICRAKELQIPGAHNLENALAAVCLASVMGIEAEAIAETLRTFPGVEHRIEFVREVGGVRYINDSKGTNPDAAIKAIEAMERPTILLLGGYDKHSEFDGLFRAFTPQIVGAVLLGETREKLKKAADEAGFTSYLLADTFEEAVEKATGIAKEGYNVLLSPACASWDMFKDFEERGRVFKKIVSQL